MAKRKWTKEEVDEYRKVHISPLYFNRDDANFFVQKSYGFGMTMNFASPISWIIVAALIALVLFTR